MENWRMGDSDSDSDESDTEIGSTILGNRSGSNNHRNGNLVAQGRSLHPMKTKNVTNDDSGVFLEYLSGTVDTDNEASDIENVPHSTPIPVRTAQSIKLKDPLNILKIDLEKVDRAIDKKDLSKVGEIKTNVERINFMIDTANPKLKRKRGVNPRELLDQSNFYMKQPYKGYFGRFELELYRKLTHKTDDETGYKMQKLHKVRFLHRSDSEVEEIFALPSGSGRYVVLQWADTNFPLFVASVILKEKSVTEKDEKSLFENRHLARYKMKKGESLNTTSEFHQRFAPKVYTKFHAIVKDGNDEIKEMLGFAKGSKVTMQVQLEAILFPHAVIDINSYSELCEKLSAIYSNPNANRSRDFDGYLSKVPKNRQDQLDNLLHHKLDQFFRLTSRPDDVFGKLKNFYITQKDSTKYFQADYYRIYYKNKFVKTFHERPQLYDLRAVINKNFVSNGFSSFVKCFDSLTISTSPSEVRIVKDKFLNCLEGVFYDDDAEKNYWKVGYDWYEVSLKYSFDVYAEYVRVLKASLLHKDDCSLKILWPLKKDRTIPTMGPYYNEKIVKFSQAGYKRNRYEVEGEYNILYKDRLHFFVADARVVPFGVEICDLFELIPNPVGKSTIHLHHVKKAFGADGYRVAVCQILCSAYYLRDTFQKGDRSEDTPAFKLFEFIKEKNDVYPNYEEFLEHLQKATFVFSPLFESGDRELDKDYMSLFKFDFSDIEDEIAGESRDDLKIKLESFLLSSEYIYPDGKFTQKWYDACAVGRDRGFQRQDHHRRHVDTFPCSSNLTPKQLRKILKEKYYKTVDGLPVKQLIVHLHEVLTFMGFGFKICQIEGERDNLLP